MDNAVVCEDFADGKRFEVALAVQLIVSPALFHAVQNFGSGLKLDVEDFAFAPCKCVYESLMDYYADYKEPITLEFTHWLTDDLANGRKPGAKTPPLIAEELPWLKYILDTAAMTQPSPGEFYARKVYDFVLMQRVRGTIANYTDPLTRGVGAADMIKDLAKLKDTGATTRQFGVWRANQLEHPIEAEDICRVPTGIHMLDACINRGLAAGELGIIGGITGLGKTNTLIQFAVSAIEKGHHSLVISMELSRLAITDRAHAMMGHIPGSQLKDPLSLWTPENCELLREVLDNPGLSGSLCVEHLTGAERTIVILDRAIEAWKAAELQMYGSTRQATIVCVDYLDKLAEHAPNLSKNENEWTKFERLSDQLRELAQKHNVALWTAVQGTTSAVRTHTPKMDHISGGLHKIKPADIALFLQLTREAEEQEASAMQSESESADMARGMLISVLKNRNGQKRRVETYQGYDLRMWDKKESFDIAIQMAKDRLVKKDLFIGKAA